MLISYRFNNFCSFNGENEFELNAPGGKIKKRFPDNFVEKDNGYTLLKTAVIVGENAGGKSNFINSLKFIKTVFANNESVMAIHSYINSSSLKENIVPRQNFEIWIVADNGIVYNYELIIDEKGIVAERLSNKKKKSGTLQNIMYVERRSGKNNYEVELSSSAEELKKIMEKNSSNMGLFITKMALLGDEDAVAVVEWINRKLIPESIDMDKGAEIKRLEDDLRIINDSRYVDIFRMVDYSICDIKVDDEKPYSKTIIIRKDENGNIFNRELQMDSTGVREFFVWAVQIYRVVYENKIVFADEMDRVLNPILSDRVIAFINGKEHCGQFIFSTHNVLHLNLKTYMKEQIYFVTKDKDTLTSEMYSLSDFPEVRYETTKIYEFYMKGILGGTAFA